jgi:type IV pilus modification protein PilV
MKKQKGFTLLEVMIGLVILAVGLLGVANMATMSIRANANAGQLTNAYQSAQAEMEKLRALPWGSLVNGSNTRTSKGMTFTNSWTISTTGNMKDVTLSVSWVDKTDHKIDLKTKIAR